MKQENDLLIGARKDIQLATTLLAVENHKKSLRFEMDVKLAILTLLNAIQNLEEYVNP